MVFRMGACKSCQERKAAIVKAANNAKQYAAKYFAKKTKGEK